MDNAILNRLHNVMLEILDEFVRICDDNNLIYFLHYGTLLGAVRHKGFIPWDDDLDVAMPRKDYEKFLDICERDNKFNYYIFPGRTPGNIYPHIIQYTKLCKKGTVYAESTVVPERYTGIFIDIFPFDNCVLPLVHLQNFLVKSVLNLYLMKIHLYTPPSPLTTIKKINIFFGKLLGFILPVKFFRILHSGLCLLFNKFDTKYISFFSGYAAYKKQTHKYEEIFPLAKIQFEKKYYCVPGNWDLFLKISYGNYMELPPVEKRINPHEPKYIVFE